MIRGGWTLNYAGTLICIFGLYILAIEKGGDIGGGTHIFLKSRNVIIKMTYVMQTPPQGPWVH